GNNEECALRPKFQRFAGLIQRKKAHLFLKKALATGYWLLIRKGGKLVTGSAWQVWAVWGPVCAGDPDAGPFGVGGGLSSDQQGAGISGGVVLVSQGLRGPAHALVSRPASDQSPGRVADLHQAGGPGPYRGPQDQQHPGPGA